jgi:hypothetical protein
MSNAKDVASALVKSELWSGANPNTILMLCYLAEAEGHHPAVVYRDYHIMQGKPSKKAEAILRDFSAAGGRVEWHALDDTKADATFRHPSGTVRIEWTMERASQAGLNTAVWKKYPRQMLRSRCISEGVRSVCPAATSGLYEENEVADIVAEQRPANDPAPAALEHHVPVETDTPQGRAEYPFPDGPASGITQLKSLVREVWRDIKACEDGEQLAGCLLSHKAVIDQAEALQNPTHRETLWAGDGKDNPGLSGIIEQAEAAFGKPTILQAG